MRWRQTFTPKFVGHTSQPIENIWNTSVDYRRVYSEVYAPHQYEVCHVDGQTCWPQLTKDVDCAALMRDYRALLETYVPVVPGPREIPAAQRDEFLLNNWTLLSPMYMAQMSHSAHAPVPVWTSDTIKDFVQKAEARVAVGGYGWAALPIYTALDCHPVTGLQGAVFGTENPWVEALLFTFGKSSLCGSESVFEQMHCRACFPRSWRPVHDLGFEILVACLMNSLNRRHLHHNNRVSFYYFPHSQPSSSEATAVGEGCTEWGAGQC